MTASSRRTTRAPTPNGPPSLCPVRVSASTPSAAKSTGTWPTAWTASVCTGMPCARGDRDDLVDRLERADLVVGEHHRDQRDRLRVALDGGPQRVDVEPGPLVDGQQLHLGALVLRPASRSGSSTAWCSIARREDAGAARIGVATGPVDALDREVVGLGAARGEDDLARPAVERLGDPLARLLHDAGARCGRRRAASWGCRRRARRLVIASMASGSIGVVAAWSR